MNNLEVFFFSTLHLFQIFLLCLWKVYFFGIVKHCKSCRKYKDNTYKNIKIKLHCPQESYLKSFWDSWMFLMCTLRWWKWENDYPQESHLKYLWSTWMVFIRLPAWVNDFPQELQMKSFWFLWMGFTCLLIASATLKFSQRSQIFQMWLMWKIIDIS